MLFLLSLVTLCLQIVSTRHSSCTVFTHSRCASSFGRGWWDYREIGWAPLFWYEWLRLDVRRQAYALGVKEQRLVADDTQPCRMQCAFVLGRIRYEQIDRRKIFEIGVAE